MFLIRKKLLLMKRACIFFHFRHIILCSAGVWLGVQVIQPGAQPREAHRQEEEEPWFGNTQTEVYKKEEV